MLHRDELYTDRPVRFKIHKPNELSKWRYGLVQYVNYERMRVTYTNGKDNPEHEYISIDDIKTGKAEIELLGDG